MFNWNPNGKKGQQDERTPEERLEAFSALIAKRINDLEVKWERDRADLWKAIKDTQEEASKPQKPVNVTELEQKLAVLETWRAQLHNLLIERGNTGKEKPTRTGNAIAKFYGR